MRGKELGIEVNCGDAGQRRQYIATQKSTWGTYNEILIHKKIFETPVVINMPSLKRHHSSFLTCALKNNFGAVYGPQRWDSHIRGEGLEKMSKKAKIRLNEYFFITRYQFFQPPQSLHTGIEHPLIITSLNTYEKWFVILKVKVLYSDSSTFNSSVAA